MRRLAVAFVITLMLVPVAVSAAPAPAPRAAAAQTIQPYFPDRLNWEHKRPQDVGMTAAKLEEAVKLAIATENPATTFSVVLHLKNGTEFETPDYGTRDAAEAAKARIGQALRQTAS